MTIIQGIILSYIKYHGNIDLREISTVVNENVDLIADEILTLHNKGFFKINNGKCFVNEDKLDEAIIDWEKIISGKEPGDSFDSNNDYGVLRSDDGFAVLESKQSVRKMLQLNNLSVEYHLFNVSSHGKQRTICSPSWNLKKRQSWILKNILNNYKLPNCVHGFVQGKSIVTNAKCHLGAQEIACVDIQDFFPSVNSESVYKIFTELGYSKEVSAILVELCTFEGVLPQGAPTSPMLANIALAGFDKYMMEYSKKENIIYSRYADDITISGNKDLSGYVEIIRTTLKQYGFELNESKTHIMKGKQRKIVTGLVVSDTVKIPKRYKRRLRQELYYCNKYGIRSHLAKRGRTSAVNFEEYLYGKAYFVKMVEPEIGEQFLEQLDVIFERNM